MHVCAFALTAVRKIHANVASMMLQLAEDSSKALKEGHVKNSSWNKLSRIL
jgi:hypothetical protein